MPPSADIRAMHESNRAAWNEGARHYRDHLEKTIRLLKAGQSSLHPIERRNLGDLRRFEKAVHLQCASGHDTLSLWLEGVQCVVGVDISDVHIENARKTSAALNAPAEWLRCDLLDTPRRLDHTADLVYTGRGALCWLHDLNGWAAAIFRLLKPGGTFHVLDTHPFTWLVDFEADQLRFAGTPYFNYSESSQGWPAAYIGDSLGIPAAQQALKHERLWTLSEIINSLIQAGLVIDALGEHSEDYWDSLPNLPQAQKNLIPLTFSILAHRAEE